MAKKQTGGLEVADETLFLKRSWVVQRVGWTAMLVIVFASLLGAFGRGPISSVSAGTAEAGLEIEYNRFARHLAETDVRIRASRKANDSTIAIRVTEDWISQFEILSISPEPDRTITRAGGRTYEFRASDAGTVQVTFKMQPQKIGRHSGSIALVGGPAMGIRQFIYP